MATVITEGELKKRIHRMYQEAVDMYKDQPNITIADTNRNIILDWLDEAKKDFPEVPLNHPEELTAEDYYLELSNDREKWFRKWFGDSS